MRSLSEPGTSCSAVRHDSPVDLAVVGAGPAGSSAARRAAMSGLNVLLLEKHAMPRHKLCGGGVSEKALQHLGFSLPDDLINAECYGARTWYRGTRTVDRVDQRIAVLVSRERFDEVLAKEAIAAGATLETTEVKELVRHDNVFSLVTSERTIQARAVIIAQGATGKLIRHVRKSDRPYQCGFCLEHRFPVSDPDPYHDLNGLIEVTFGVCRFGYGWVFHHGSYYSVGIGGVRFLLKNPLAIFREFCRHKGFNADDVKPRGHPIPCGGMPRTIVGEGILLAGDSAGFVDPFQGEGIAYAIRSGQLAAETMVEAIKEGDLSKSSLRRYATRCNREFGRDLMAALSFACVTHSGSRLFLPLMTTDDSVRRKFLEVLPGRMSYTEYLRWITLHFPITVAKAIAAKKRRCQA